jgi:hypothetical protein
MYQFEPDHYPRKDSDSAIADRRVNDLTAAGDKPHKFTGNGG